MAGALILHGIPTEENLNNFLQGQSAVLTPKQYFVILCRVRFQESSQESTDGCLDDRKRWLIICDGGGSTDQMLAGSETRELTGRSNLVLFSFEHELAIFPIRKATYPTRMTTVQMSSSAVVKNHDSADKANAIEKTLD